MAKMDEATRKRMRAGRLRLAGKMPAEAAKAVGVARQTAYTWKARLDEGGSEALRVMATGRPARLDASPLEGLPVALLQGPLAHGFGTEVVDAQTRTGAYRAAVWHHLQPGTYLAIAGRLGFQFTKAGAPSHRTQRASRADLEAQNLACA